MNQRDVTLDLPPTELAREASRRRWIDSFGIVLICIISAALLRWIGRVWWCQCGSSVPWAWEIWSQHNSQHAIDPYIFTHVLHGVILCGLLYALRNTKLGRWRFLMAVGLEGCWELLENSPIIIDRYRESTMALDYVGDSITNSLFDILACASGYQIAIRAGWKRSLPLIVATELMLLVTIKDNLILNIIMLIYPIDAIKTWQMQGVTLQAFLFV